MTPLPVMVAASMVTSLVVVPVLVRRLVMRLMSPPIREMGPSMLTEPFKVMACVLPVLPRVKPLSVLPKVRLVVSKVLVKLAPLG